MVSAVSVVQEVVARVGRGGYLGLVKIVVAEVDEVRLQLQVKEGVTRSLALSRYMEANLGGSGFCR